MLEESAAPPTEILRFAQNDNMVWALVWGCRRSTCHCEVSEGLLRVASGDTDSPLARAAATKQSLKDANEDCFAEPVLSAVRFFASAQNESKRRARNNTNTLLDKAL